MTEEKRLKWMYFDACYEGTNNPFLRLYYLGRMKWIELWDKRKDKTYGKKKHR